MDRKTSIINLQAKIWEVLPRGLKQNINLFRIMPRYLNWYYSPIGRSHMKNVISPYKDRFKNYRCVIIGNGPSLTKMNLLPLKNEFTFGLNRIYMLFEKWGFETSFLVSVNRFVLTQFTKDLRSLNMLKFLNWRYRSQFSPNDHTVFLSPKPYHKMDGNIINGFYPLFGTVTNVALEIAYFMGFSEVILIGVDHSFADKGIGGIAVLSQKSDQNHFSPDYFGPGVVWQLPNFVVMEQGYENMKNLYEQAGRKIKDATVDGKLSIFPKVNFEEYLKESKFINKSG